jgi:hypothetical protein
MKITSVTDITETTGTGNDITAVTDTGRPYLLESREFERFVHAQRTAASRGISDLTNEIQRLQIQIDAREARRRDLVLIVQRADAMLALQLDDITQTIGAGEDDTNG